MESEFNQKEPKRDGRGGARPGAGRPKGAKDRVSVQSLIEALEHKSGGQSYEEILIEDFLQARLENDRAMTHKYHTLISSKLISTLNAIEVDASEDLVAAKQAMFAEAIAQIAAKNTQG